MPVSSFTRHIVAAMSCCMAATLSMLAPNMVHAEGQVSTYHNGTLLYISGDQHDNSIKLVRDATGQLLVYGLNGTRIGNYRGKGFYGVERVIINLDDGQDRVSVLADLESLYVMSETTFMIGNEIEEDAEIFSQAVVLSGAWVGGDLIVEGAHGFLGQTPSSLDDSLYVDIDHLQVEGDTMIQGTDGEDFLAIEASTFEYFQVDLYGGADRVSLTAMDDDLTFGKLLMMLGSGYDQIQYAEASFQGVIRTHRITALDPDSAVYGGKYWESSAARIKFDQFYSWTADFGVPDIGELFGVNTGAFTPISRWGN